MDDYKDFKPLNIKLAKEEFLKISDLDGYDFYTHSYRHKVGITITTKDWKPDSDIDCGNGFHLCKTLDDIFDIVGQKPCLLWVVKTLPKNTVKSRNSNKWRAKSITFIRKIRLNGKSTDKYNIAISGKFKAVEKITIFWGNATVEAGDNATVEAGDNATVEAWGNATVKAWDNATVEAGGNATVEAGDNATVKAWDNATVEAGGNATVKAWDNATVEAGDNATVEAGDNATVEAWGNATVKAWDNATVKAGDNATVEAWGNATVIKYNKKVKINLKTNSLAVVINRSIYSKVTVRKARKPK